MSVLQNQDHAVRGGACRKPSTPRAKSPTKYLRAARLGHLVRVEVGSGPDTTSQMLRGRHLSPSLRPPLGIFVRPDAGTTAVLHVPFLPLLVPDVPALHAAVPSDVDD